jgi:hypothetical protein
MQASARQNAKRHAASSLVVSSKESGGEFGPAARQAAP